MNGFSCHKPPNKLLTDEDIAALDATTAFSFGSPTDRVDEALFLDAQRSGFSNDDSGKVVRNSPVMRSFASGLREQMVGEDGESLAKVRKLDSLPEKTETQ